MLKKYGFKRNSASRCSTKVNIDSGKAVWGSATGQESGPYQKIEPCNKPRSEVTQNV